MHPLQREKDLLERIAERALKLLKEEPDPRSSILWVEKCLQEANLLNTDGNRDNLREWANTVIRDNPNLLEISIPWVVEHNSHPEKAETLEDLIWALIPQEGGL